jgi:membrane fusion protein, heavy metal efflux system
VNKVIGLLILLLTMSSCNKQDPPAKTSEEPPKLSVTHWSDKTELFMEYPPLVIGETARFAIHLTHLHTFKPLTSGRVSVQLATMNGAEEVFSSDAPSRPGIFGVDVQPKESGTYAMSVRLNSADLEDVHELGSVTVFSDAAQAAASAKAKEEKRETISFLKEQQWSMEFATETVKERSLRESLRVPAEVRPRTGGEAEVTAPVAGRLSAASALPAIGTRVAKGQTLASLVPRTGNPADRAQLELGVAETTTALELARKDRERVERLLSAGAIPAKRVEEALASEATQAARLRAAQLRLAQHELTRRAGGDPPKDTAFLLRSPLSGVVAESHATDGASVEEGEKLYQIMAVDTVYVVGNVPESEAWRLRQVSGGELEVPGLEQPLALGRLISVGRIIDPTSRTLSVIYEVANSQRLLAMGQAVFLRLFTSAKTEGPSLPESAVVDDAGRPVVFVQVAGESFERRPVRLGSQESGYLRVLEGVKPGERVVTRGTYLIRLAALSSQIPAHGHVH